MYIDLIKKRIKNSPIKPLGVKAKYAVLVPLIKLDDKLHLIYEIRSEEIGTQPGEVSFPGGRIEEGETARDAAIRETEEELGLNTDQIEVFGQLDYLIPPFNIALYPFAGFLKVDSLEELEINKAEVQQIFIVPFNYFLENEPETHVINCRHEINENFPYHLIRNGKDYDWRNGEYPVNFYKYKDFVIWGMTARFTTNLIDKIKNN
ncbi:MAG TPA: CoA pyrophosphatase [Halanaerobiales bacterium]|nr:CoA pyrophosphatase [Halanaerobiales bacterium]